MNSRGFIGGIIEQAVPNVLTPNMPGSKLRHNVRLLQGWLKHLPNSVLGFTKNMLKFSNA